VDIEQLVYVVYVHLHEESMYICIEGRRGRDRIVVEFTTTYVINIYHEWSDFESYS
jgi:hypothetical protein